MPTPTVPLANDYMEVNQACKEQEVKFEAQTNMQ